MSHYEQTTQEVRDAFNALCKGRVKAAVAREREECAKVIESHGPFLANGAMLADAIRARGSNT